MLVINQQHLYTEGVPLPGGAGHGFTHGAGGRRWCAYLWNTRKTVLGEQEPQGNFEAE